MSRRKRSGRLAVPLLVLVALAGCSSSDDSARVLAAAGRHPVAVLTTPDEWAEGVKAHPLQLGQSLAFVFPDAGSPVWNMRGVDYPLFVQALDQGGNVLETVPMAPCPRPASSADCEYPTSASSAVWVEVR